MADAILVFSEDPVGDSGHCPTYFAWYLRTDDATLSEILSGTHPIKFGLSASENFNELQFSSRSADSLATALVEIKKCLEDESRPPRTLGFEENTRVYLWSMYTKAKLQEL